jgi:thiol-disulfide isomerase/thioredoxin
MVGMPGKLRRSAALAAVLVGVAGCAGTSAGNNTEAGGSFQLGDGNINVYQPGHREMVGDVSGKTLQGKPLSLAQYRGKVVVVDFWSYNCGPCRGEEQTLESLSRKYADKGVQFVGIDERDNLDSALAFEQNYHVTYPSLFDRTDAYVLDFPGAAPPSTPTTIVLDPTGHIAARVSGGQDYTHLDALIDKIRTESA